MAFRKFDIQFVSAWGCLLLGIGIYLLFRSRGHLGFMVLDSLGFVSTLDSIRSLTKDVEVADFVRFCLPDGLWTTSYILFSDHFNRHESLRSRLLLASVIPALGLASEMMQLWEILPGVFDVMDLVCYGLPLLAYYMIIVK